MNQLIPKHPKRKRQPTAACMREQLALAADEIIRLREVSVSRARGWAKYEASIVTGSTYSGAIHTMRFRCWFRWQAVLVCWSYLYGTAFMPLAGARVIDAYVLQIDSAMAKEPK